MLPALDNRRLCADNSDGGIAQLGERLNGIQEVSGSIPLISTIKTEVSFETSVFLFPAVFKTKRAQEAFLIPAVVLRRGENMCCGKLP